MSVEIDLEIVGRINGLHATAMDGAELCRIHGEVAVIAAWTCGGLLLHEKAKLKHGEWLGWLESNCPLLPMRTAQRYMNCAAQFRTMEDLRAARLQRTYAVAGILPENEHTGLQAAMPRPDEGLLFVQRACQYFNKNDLMKLNDVGRGAWRDRLRPLAELYARLGGTV